MLKMLPPLSVPKHLAIAVTFHFVEDRLKYLAMLAEHFTSLADKVTVYIITNRREKKELNLIADAVRGQGFDINFLTPIGLGHPFLLTWSHFVAFRTLMQDESVSHFMYLEDDILVRRESVEYWMQGRELLRKTPFYPSFLRVEKNEQDGRWYSSDCLKRHDVGSLPRVAFGQDLWFLNLPSPYQGMYLLDREQMQEHLTSASSVPEFHPLGWGIREQAAQGLSFARVPDGFRTRNLLAYWPQTSKIDERAFVHHTPNTYVLMAHQDVPLGSIPVDELLYREADQAKQAEADLT